MLNEKGIIPIVLGLGIVFILALSGGAYYLYTQKNNSQIIPQTDIQIVTSPQPTSLPTIQPTAVPKSNPTSTPKSTPKLTPKPTATPTQMPTPTPVPIAAMTFNGVAQINAGQNAPAESVVNVFINGVVCGTAFTNSEQVNFSMEVMSATQKPGCGTSGSTMTFRINDMMAQQNMGFNPGKHEANVILNVYY